jgi:YidC/Oxa1 family membrane protein insertase
MVVSANIFQPLIDVFQSVLVFFHNNVGVSWGFSIICLTILIRALLIPLTLKQFHSMQALQRLQPELKALQNKYKEDKQRQQQELMKFYKENKVNPLGSCLPLVAQLPVFISLFYMLRKNLRADICPKVQHAFQAIHGAAATTPCGANHGAGFLFIPDLTNKASGAVLIVLIVLYVGTQLASSLMMSSATMDKTQRQIMLLMPLLFVFFILSFPAGVIVYWITTNSWTILQQYVVRRRLGPVNVPAVAGAAVANGGGASKTGPTAKTGSGTSGTGANGADGASTGGGLAGGLGALLRGKPKATDEPAAIGAAARNRGAAPPPPPRKKKKRSGRRR